MTATADPALLLTHVLGPGRVVHKYRYANGLTVLAVPEPATPVIAYHTWFGVGSRHERPGRTGIAHLFEHMMFKATSTMPEGEFDRRLESIGGQTNAATWVDWTYYHEALPASRENLELAVRLEADRMVNLRVDSEQLEAEREVVKNERTYRVDDDPDGRMYEELYRLAFGEHPYGWPTIGWMKDIEAITLSDCEAFYRAYYAPNNAVVILTGGFELDHALATITASYGHLPPATLPLETRPTPVERRDTARSTLSLPGVSTPRVVIGFPSPAIDDPDLAPLGVGLEILAGGVSSRLQVLLVDRLEVATQVEAWTSHFHYPGIAELYASIKPGGDPAQVEELLLAEVARLAETPPTARELERAKNQLEAAEYRSAESASALAYRLGHFETTAGDFRRFPAAVRALQQVSAERVREAIATHLRPEARTTVCVLPVGD